MSKHRVSTRGSILVGSKLFRPGERIPDGTFTGDQIKEHMRSGFLVKIGADDDYGNDPGVKPVPTDIDLSGGDNAPKAPQTKDVPNTENLEKIEKLQSTGKWNRDPDKLKSMTLEELNTTVIEIDHETEPFKTKKEAVAWLSQDFVSS